MIGYGIAELERNHAKPTPLYIHADNQKSMLLRVCSRLICQGWAASQQSHSGRMKRIKTICNLEDRISKQTSKRRVWREPKVWSEYELAMGFDN
jgi:hypothetical protein